jgi:copper(I)-binding protein
MQTASMIAAGACLLLASCGQGAPEIAVDRAWARATVPGQTQAAVYLRVVNGGGGSDGLLSATTALARMATLHEVSNEGGIHRMRPSERVEVGARSTIEFSPGGKHIMLSGVGQSLQAGTSFPLTLRFGRSGVREVTVEVREAAATAHSGHGQ